MNMDDITTGIIKGTILDSCLHEAYEDNVDNIYSWVSYDKIRNIQRSVEDIHNNGIDLQRSLTISVIGEVYEQNMMTVLMRGVSTRNGLLYFGNRTPLSGDIWDHVAHGLVTDKGKRSLNTLSKKIHDLIVHINSEYEHDCFSYDDIYNNKVSDIEYNSDEEFMENMKEEEEEDL